jgi:hypothetical protein
VLDQEGQQGQDPLASPEWIEQLVPVVVVGGVGGVGVVAA